MNSQHVFVSVVQEWTAVPDFTHHAHTASITTVAASERFVVTGSKDETIQLYDMKKRTEFGALLHHDGEHVWADPLFCSSLLGPYKM